MSVCEVVVLNTKLLEEVWKDIPGYEGLYQSSNLGRIKSLRRNGTPERIMKARSDKDGYQILDLRRKYKRKTCRVHRLIALTFLDNPKDKSEVNHINFNKRDNSVSNLEWMTPDENKQHSIKHGVSGEYSKRWNQ